MELIIGIVLKNLITTWLLLIPLAFLRLCDIGLGVLIANKDITMKFSWSKLLKGLIYSILLLVCISLFVSAVTMIPAILDLRGITGIDTDIFQTVLNYLALISILITTIITWGQDVFNKFKTYFLIGNIEEQQDKIDADKTAVMGGGINGKNF